MSNAEETIKVARHSLKPKPIKKTQSWDLIPNNTQVPITSKDFAQSIVDRNGFMVAEVYKGHPEAEANALLLAAALDLLAAAKLLVQSDLEGDHDKWAKAVDAARSAIARAEL